MKQIFTIGYGDKEFDQFLNLLKENIIETIVDVRSFPTSKLPEYEKENLERRLKDSGINYYHFEGLGGYRDEGYEKYMKTEEFRKSLKKLEEIAQNQKTVIMCLESYPSRCHRRYISGTLDEKGWEIVHLVGEKGKQETISSQLDDHQCKHDFNEDYE